MRKCLVLTLLSVVYFFSSAWSALPESHLMISKYDHFITTTLTDPYSFMLEDGSVWSFGTKTHLNKKMKLLFANWKEGQPVEFSLESGIFKNWYYLHNLETGDKIETELLSEPTDELSLYIVEFDINTKTITLSDGSKWVINKKNCSHCLNRIKQRFVNKIFVARQHKTDKFFLITSNSSLEHIEVMPAF